MTDRISAGERPKPDSMMCVNCGTVVFHAVELDTQRCRCGVGAGCWVCNYSKVSVSIIEHEDKISALSSELEKAKAELSAMKMPDKTNPVASLVNALVFDWETKEKLNQYLIELQAERDAWKMRFLERTSHE